MAEFFPEGFIINTKDNNNFLNSNSSLMQAKLLGKILEAKAILCDNKHNLIVNLGCMKGFIPRNEVAIEQNGEKLKDIAIISRVNKPVCFVVSKFENKSNGKTLAILSRKAAQEMCFEHKISKMCSGDVIDAVVTHLENFGAFVDIGCGIISFLPIDMISVSRITHANERFKQGMKIKVIIKSITKERVNLTHKELLGTWEENVSRFSIGETVPGIVRSIEDYGIFVELSPNLAGLAELRTDVYKGQQISVYIKNIIPEKMKIKLVVIETFDTKPKVEYPKYFFHEDHMEKFIYSPLCCQKVIETNFSSLVKV